MSVNVIGKHLCNIINMDIENYNVPDNTKVAQLFIELAIQEKSRNELARKLARDPVSLLNGSLDPFRY